MTPCLIQWTQLFINCHTMLVVFSIYYKLSNDVKYILSIPNYKFSMKKIITKYKIIFKILDAFMKGIQLALLITNVKDTDLIHSIIKIKNKIYDNIY